MHDAEPRMSEPSAITTLRREQFLYDGGGEVVCFAATVVQAYDAMQQRAEAAEAQLVATDAALAELAHWPDLPRIQYGVRLEKDGEHTILAVRGDQVIGVMEAIYAHIKTLAPFGDTAVQALYQHDALKAALREETSRVDRAVVECAALRTVVSTMEAIACEAYAHWDKGEDSKVGKYLASLGGTTGIRVDLDRVRDAARAAQP